MAARQPGAKTTVISFITLRKQANCPLALNFSQQRIQSKRDRDTDDRGTARKPRQADKAAGGTQMTEPRRLVASISDDADSGVSITFPVTKEKIRELERQAGGSDPFALRLVAHMGAREKVMPYAQFEKLRERSLTDELFAARKVSERSFGWAVEAVRTMGFEDAAKRAEQART